MLTDEQRCQPSPARKWLTVQVQSCYYRLLKAFRGTDLKYASRDGGGDVQSAGGTRYAASATTPGIARENDKAFFQMMPTRPKAFQNVVLQLGFVVIASSGCCLSPILEQSWHLLNLFSTYPTATWWPLPSLYQSELCSSVSCWELFSTLTCPREPIAR